MAESKDQVSYLPVPTSATFCGLVGSSSFTLSVAFLVPVALGVKVTEIEQVPRGRIAPTQLSVSRKSAALVPVIVRLLTLRVIELNLILQVTGLDHDNQVAKLVFSTLKSLKQSADFKTAAPPIEEPKSKELAAANSELKSQTLPSAGTVGLNLSYTINLNLPATPDQAVFNAIFKSLKEHLLSNE